MDKVRIIEVKESVLASNDAEVDRIRSEMKAKETFFIDLMSSPGSGKTTLKRLIGDMKDRYRF